MTICERCGAVLRVGSFPFCRRGPSDHETGFTAVIGDAMDHLQINGTATPIRFRSRSEHRRWLKEHGYTIKDSHIPAPGSDKSTHTSNWAQSYDPYTAENARILIERAFHQKPDEPESPMHITTHTGELTPAEAATYSQRNTP